MKSNPSQLKNIRKAGVYIGVPGLGDLIFIMPLFRAIKQGFPGCETVFIGQLQKPYVKPLFDACPHIDRLLDYHFYSPGGMPMHMDFIRRMRGEKFDLLVDTQRKAAPTALLKMCGARRMVSYAMGGVFSDFMVPPSGDRSARHTADVSLDLARALGLNPEVSLDLFVPERHREYAAAFYGERGVGADERLLGLVPSASEPTRCWPAERFGELAGRMHAAFGLRPMCFGSHADQGIIDRVAAACPAPVLVEDFSRGNILDSAALMQRCAAMVGNVSGPLHIADALGVPAVGIYGPHPPGRFGLLGPRSRAVCLNRDCAPCRDSACAHRRCIMDISVELVERAVMEIVPV